MARIKDLLQEERPREKLLRTGAETLTDVELIAILLRTGRKGMSVLEIARETHEHLFDGHLERYGRTGWRELTEIAGIGPDKAATLCAAVELGRRLARHRAADTRADFSDPEQIAAYFMPQMQYLPYEEFYCCYLSTKNRLLAAVMKSRGGISSSPADARMIFGDAFSWNAAACILVHNHPSGSPEPSVADIRTTARLVRAGELLDIPILDHVIIGDGVFVSMRRQGLL